MHLAPTARMLVWVVRALCVLHVLRCCGGQEEKEPDFEKLAMESRKESEEPKTAAPARAAGPVGSFAAPARDSAPSASGRGPQRLQNLVHGNRGVPPSMAKKAQLFTRTATTFVQKTGMPLPEIQKSARAMAAFKTVMKDVCDRNIPNCDLPHPYRTADGSCNNLEKPLQGSTLTPQFRELTPAYQDDIGKPRTRGKDNLLLPSARTISVAIHRSTAKSTPRDDRHTIYLMQWGQFLDHDLVITPLETGTGELCCGSFGRDECFPIQIVQPDPHFEQNCMDFMRSLPAVDPECITGQREQVNLLTSYIDASNVYGSSQNEQDALRTFSNGKLKVERTNMLPRDSNDACVLDSASGDYCPKAGDQRVAEQSSLSTIHTVFLREHNRIASRLAIMNPSWDDEKIFQETRKIISAQIQHITYNEFLPELVGPAIMSRYGLRPTPKGHNNVYKTSADASVGNAFSAAAFRWGHSAIPGFLLAMDKFQFVTKVTPLQDVFFNPKFYLSNAGQTVDHNARWMSVEKGFKADAFLEKSVVDLLFLTGGDSLDLASLNIQRGRDHGIRPYVEWREICDLSRIFRWGTGIGGLADHTPEIAAKLQNVYRNVEDIDLFTGGMTETPVFGGVVGQTFACIIAKQFRRSKIGDRFYYENSDSVTGFTEAQVNEIKKVTLSKLLCDNMNIGKVQKSAFLRQGTRLFCPLIQGMNLEAWNASPVPPPTTPKPPKPPKKTKQQRKADRLRRRKQKRQQKLKRTCRGPRCRARGQNIPGWFFWLP